MSEEVSIEEQNEIASSLDAMSGLLSQEAIEGFKKEPAAPAPAPETQPTEGGEQKSLAESMQQKAAQENLNPGGDIDPLEPQEAPGEQPQGGSEGGEEFAPELGDSKSTVKVKSPIFGDKETEYLKSPEQNNEISFEKLEDVNEHVKSNFGVESVEKLFGSAEKWRTAAQKTSEFETKVEQFNKLFESLPDELYNSIVEYSKGNDWTKSVVSNQVVDLSKSIDSYSTKQLVDAYFPDQFSQEDWDAYKDEDHENHNLIKKAIDLAEGQSKNQFSNQKTELRQKRDGYLESARQKEESLSASLGVSAKKLRESFPQGVSDSYVDTITNEFKSGGVDSLFYDNNGNLKEDAMVKYAMAKDGLDLLRQVEGAITHRAETKERQELLDRTPDTVSSNKRGSQKEEISPAVQKILDEVSELKQKTTF